MRIFSNYLESSEAKKSHKISSHAKLLFMVSSFSILKSLGMLLLYHSDAWKKWRNIRCILWSCILVDGDLLDRQSIVDALCGIDDVLLESSWIHLSIGLYFHGEHLKIEFLANLEGLLFFLFSECFNRCFHVDLAHLEFFVFL